MANNNKPYDNLNKAYQPKPPQPAPPPKIDQSRDIPKMIALKFYFKKSLNGRSIMYDPVKGNFYLTPLQSVVDFLDWHQFPTTDVEALPSMNEYLSDIDANQIGRVRYALWQEYVVNKLSVEQAVAKILGEK